MQDIETVELRSLHCIKLRMNVSPPASSYVMPPRRSQGGRMGLLQGSKVAVIGDKAEEEAGTGKDTTTHRGAWWQGSEGRASLPPIQHPHQSSATWPEETGRTLGHQHCDHNISRQRSLEERVFRSTMRGQRVDLSKGHPRPTVLTSQQGQPSTDTAPVVHAGRGNAWDSCHNEETKGQQGTSQGAGNQLPPRSFPRAMSRLGKETHLTCRSPGFSGLYKDRISTCSGTSLYPYPGISSQCCRTYKALCSSSTDQFSSATPLSFLTEASAVGHSQVEDEGIWSARATSGR